jgi:hypothetical protein
MKVEVTNGTAILTTASGTETKGRSLPGKSAAPTSAPPVRADAASPEPEFVVQPGAPVSVIRLAAGAAPTPAARLRKGCIAAAEAAEQAGHQVLAGAQSGASRSLGDRTARHIEARQQAHGACRMAIAAAALATGPDALANTGEELRAADRRWQGPSSP